MLLCKKTLLILTDFGGALWPGVAFTKFAKQPFSNLVITLPVDIYGHSL
jgi:hypothetical protein